ncbi:MAG: hypothetical protein ACOX3E_05405 [Desulfomonilia bacterium]
MKALEPPSCQKASHLSSSAPSCNHAWTMSHPEYSRTSFITSDRNSGLGLSWDAYCEI